MNKETLYLVDDIYEEDLEDSMIITYTNNGIEYSFNRSKIINAIKDFKNDSIYISLDNGFYMIKENNNYYIKNILDEVIFKSNDLNFTSCRIDCVSWRLCWDY